MWQFKKDTTVIWHYKNGDEFNGEKVDDGAWSPDMDWQEDVKRDEYELKIFD
jgi:hypothetical protein